ncbi:aryl-sulfate sulfotransferase [Tenacibaculum crassostreae]|uniref:aryl-sulfate sulfotransferase n=1 Tax=Tenacibaculum crassostreae TaxID=502683 RepID=UPI003895CAC3
MKTKILLALFTLFLLESCSNEPEKESTITIPELTNEVLVYVPEKISKNLVLVDDAANTEVYLLKKDGQKFHEWQLTNRLGNDVVLEENGKLLALLKTDNDKITFGGSGGQIQVINPDNSVDWQFVYSTEEYNLHHDIERLPNGNIIALLWEKKTAAQAQEIGYKLNKDIYIESVIEINPNTNQIVWKWSSWDHLIQDADSNKSNFGSISNNPQLIDINFNNLDHGDIMHANAIEYDKKNDLIFISVNFYHEVWVIDHSTTSEEAKNNSGGNYNKGGDLLYRFGNPSAHKTEGDQLFSNNHHCNIINDNLPGAGNMLIFNNGADNKQSIVYELQLPSSFDFNKSPDIIWSYTNSNLFSAKVSGARRVENGNTLITEGDFGYWEVTHNKELVWQYSGSGFFWRGYPYNYTDLAIKNLKSN